LIGDNETLIQEIVKYIRHVAVFKLLGLSEAELNPIDVDEPLPPGLGDLIETETSMEGGELEALRKQRWKISR